MEVENPSCIFCRTLELENLPTALMTAVRVLQPRLEQHLKRELIPEELPIAQAAGRCVVMGLDQDRVREYHELYVGPPTAVCHKDFRPEE